MPFPAETQCSIRCFEEALPGEAQEERQVLGPRKVAVEKARGLLRKCRSSLESVNPVRPKFA